MWWLYNEGGADDDVDSYDSGDVDKDDDFDLQEWWWVLERDMPAGVAISQTEVMMTEMNSEYSWNTNWWLLTHFVKEKEKKRHSS